MLFNARIRPSVFPGLAGCAGAIWSFRRQDGDVQDVLAYIVLPLCVESVVLLVLCGSAFVRTGCYNCPG